jgi:hypothetical protein
MSRGVVGFLIGVVVGISLTLAVLVWLFLGGGLAVP